MALVGLITDEGLNKAIEAQNNTGYRVFPQAFGISEQKGDFLATRDVASILPEWFHGPISAVQKIDTHTLQFICNVPAGVATEPKFSNEVYLYGKSGINQDGELFLMAIAQPTAELTYDPDGELRLRLQIKINNLDVSQLFQFYYTQATEVSDHNLDPNAHPALRSAMGKAGIFPQIGDQKFVGQTFDAFPNIGLTLNNKSIAYFDTLNNRYEAAVADGSNRQFAVGMYLFDQGTVVTEGMVDWPHQLNPYRPLYLSDTTGGQITLAKTSVKIGFALPNNKIFIRIASDAAEGSSGLSQTPDGDVEINLNPSLIRELTLEDEVGGKWDITVSDKGVLTATSGSTREPDPVFKILRLDESYAQVKVNSSGKLVIYSPPLDADAITDNAYYLQSPSLICWKFSVNLNDNIVMMVFNNSFFLSSGEFDIFVVKQSEVDKALVYQSTYEAIDLPDEPELISTLTPGTYVREVVGGKQVPCWFDGTAWRVTGVGEPVGSVDHSILSQTQYQARRGTGWVQYSSGMSIAGSQLAVVTGLTTVSGLGTIAGTNTYIRIN
jgi:hypothetical protein